MSTSASVAHLISFLTRPLLSAYAPATVTSAQLILNATLATVPSATFTLSASGTPPPSILSASIGAGIPWASWFNALGGGRDVLVFYGPTFVKVRVGDGQVTTVWSEDAQGSVTPISQLKAVPLLQQSTGARLRAALLSARVRSIRREQTAAAPIRLPSLLFASSPTSSDSDSSYDASDSDSDSDCESSTSSKFTSYSAESLLTSAASSPVSSPPKSACLPLPLYRAPRPIGVSKPSIVSADKSKKDLTAYLYQGGVTRVMTGGVMLGPRRAAAHVVKFTRS
ncbi:hypothetical protein C8J57DRAFT_1303913 [Mycena rebaudengoi]|nr:hypothetical protein C8J57DRAFT_1303913 [Mycena rebaudengoi]